MERSRRVDAEPLCTRSQHLRVKLRLPALPSPANLCGASPWDGNRRFNHQSVVDQRPGRDQADSRSRRPRRDHPHLPHSGHRRAGWDEPSATLAILLGVLASIDPEDKARRAESKDKSLEDDYTSVFSTPRKTQKGARVGVVSKDVRLQRRRGRLDQKEHHRSHEEAGSDHCRSGGDCETYGQI